MCENCLFSESNLVSRFFSLSHFFFVFFLKIRLISQKFSELIASRSPPPEQNQFTRARRYIDLPERRTQWKSQISHVRSPPFMLSTPFFLSWKVRVNFKIFTIFLLFFLPSPALFRFHLSQRNIWNLLLIIFKMLIRNLIRY